MIVGTQGVALVGALVGGTLARKRRLELQGLNVRLRQINSELRKRTSGEGVRNLSRPPTNPPILSFRPVF